MLSTQEYLFGWGMYVLSSIGLMVVWWRMTFKLRPLVLRNILRLSAAVALLTPYPVPGQEAFLAPALIMSFIEGLFYEEYGFGHAGMPLIFAIVLVNIIYLVVDLGWQFYRRKHNTDVDGKHELDGKANRDMENDDRGRSTDTSEPPEAADEDGRKEPKISV